MILGCCSRQLLGNKGLKRNGFDKQYISKPYVIRFGLLKSIEIRRMRNISNGYDDGIYRFLKNKNVHKNKIPKIRTSFDHCKLSSARDFQDPWTNQNIYRFRYKSVFAKLIYTTKSVEKF